MTAYLAKALRGLSFIAITIFAVAQTRASVFDLALSDGSNRALRMNLPGSLSVVRGILIWGNGAGGDSRNMAGDPELVALADSLGFALIATSRWGYIDPRELAVFEKSLQELSVMSGHPELTIAPWLPLGHSNGGQMSYGLNALRPEKVIGFAASKGGYYNVARPSAAALRTPGLLVAGEVDAAYRINAIRDLYDGNRPRGAKWAWLEEQRVDHAEGNSAELLRPFAEAMVRARYPTDASPANGPIQLLKLNELEGWLTDPSSYKTGMAFVAPYASYTKDKSIAGWLPNRRLAYIFRAFASYNKATTSATLSCGAGPVDSGTLVTYSIGQPAGAWTTVEFYEGDVLLKCVASTDGAKLAAEFTPATSGYLVFHAIITFADGTQRTAMPRRVLVRAAHPSASDLNPAHR